VRWFRLRTAISTLLTYLLFVTSKSTRYRVMGPELISVYRQSARRWLFKSSPRREAAITSPRPVRQNFPVEERHRLSTGNKLYCLVREVHRCEQLVQGCYAALSLWELNPRPNDRKSDALPLRHWVAVWLANFTYVRTFCDVWPIQCRNRRVPSTANCTSGDQHSMLVDHEAGAARDRHLTTVTEALAV